MKSTVYFTDSRSRLGLSIPKKFRKLLRKAEFTKIFSPSEFVAIKVHWGELDNVGYLRPVFARIVGEMVRKKGGIPFVTDTNVLYRGMRHDAVSNLKTAYLNGYNFSSLLMPVIVADGLNGRDFVEVEIENGKVLKSAKIASAIYHADAMVVISHFKGHILFGFGATLKNLGMGCATPAGKQILHSDVKPHVVEEKCIGCGDCKKVCPADAITFIKKPSKKNPNRFVSHIDSEKCIGCGECVAVCPTSAIPVNWETSQTPLLQKTAEYAKAAVSNKKGKVFYINFLYDITPDCDCADWTDVPFAPNIGILGSYDPVALDMASVDLVNSAGIVPNSVLATKQNVSDKIFALKGREYMEIIRHAERIGLGTSSYELVKV